MQSPDVEQSGDSDPFQSVRLHYLDWLRVLAVLGVFLFHAVHPFDLANWHVKNAEQSLALTIILAFFFSWGMPFFFLVAGAGSWLSLRHRTARDYARERLYRLFIPFVIGAILLTPLQLYVEWQHKIQTGVWHGSFQEALTAIWVGINPRLFGLFGLHLWFVGFLFAFSLLTLPLFGWLKGEAGHRWLARLAAQTERRGAILLFILPLVLIRLGLQPFFPQEHHWADFCFMMAFFILGYLLFSDARFTQALRRDWRLILIVGVMSTVAAMAMAVVANSFDIERPPRTLWDFTFWGFISINSWCWTLLALIAGMRFLNFSNRWMQYGQEAILPFYMFHQPVILVIAYFVVQWDAGLLFKLLITVLCSFVVSIGLYELVVRRVDRLRVLFGMKGRQRQPNDLLQTTLA